MVQAKGRPHAGEDASTVERYADMLAAMGAAPRLRIIRLLLAAHPQGLVVGDLVEELGVSGSTLSHHLEKLRREGLVSVQRQGTFLRYRADAEALEELLGFFYAECCTRNAVVDPGAVITCCAP
jgi:ArsR family transcriptional regulator, arsenate/arsenite/antimonite-responsive transcriptional repressor